MFRRGKNGFTFLLLRIFLALFVFFFVYYSKINLSIYFFVLTAFVALFDGFWARRNRIRSQLRSILDPFADKLLIDLTAVALYLKSALPFWVMIIFLVKDLLIISGAVYVLIKNQKIIFRSNVIDKVSVFIQIFTLFIVLISRLDYVLIWISIIFVVFSFAISLIRSGVKIVRYKSELEEIRFMRLIKLPDFFTLLNILMGLLAILFSMRGGYSLAIAFLIVAVFFDYFDGKVARLIRRHGSFGKQLDSLADTISFGVAPAIFGFSLIQTNLSMVVFALFIFAGVLRLARYNIMEFSEGFAGMPITVNGIVIPVIYLAKIPFDMYPYIYLFLAVLMVSPIKFKKLF